MVEAHDIFISYARHDVETARRLAELLTERGWSVWWDRNLSSGAKFRGVIEEHLNASACVIVLWSKYSIGAEFVLDEAEEAKHADKLLPLTIDGTRPPFGFRQRQTPDVSSWTMDDVHPEIEGLMRHIEQSIGPGSRTEPRPIRPAEPRFDWNESGSDSWGTWADVDLSSVRARFRWIEPGTFLMGSPVDEKGRGFDENQTEVTISSGFWLSDSAVTQELWEVVTGENPSGFKGAQRPVENVSWEDAERFIGRVNDLAPGLHLRLPLECEWEYGCRAGTRTPFTFGYTLTTEQANCNGSRSRTVDVKSLPPNGWGLYEMHGNVYEWCGDLIEGSYRVLRGGSWLSNARFCRSSYRHWRDAGRRDGLVGFRVARGQGALQAGGE